MNVLEKILEEIEEATLQEDAPIYVGDMEVDGYVRESIVKAIIRSHMNEVDNDDWIPCSKRLPNEEELAKAYVSGYAAEFLVTIEGATRSTTLYFENGKWFDDEIRPYKVVAWKPLPEAHRAAGDSKPDWKENMLNTFLAGH